MTARDLLHALAMLIIAVITCGCVSGEPASPFPVQLPQEIADNSRSIAVIGDLQLTPRFVRTVMRREENGPEQQRLIDDLYRRIDDLAALVIVGDLVFTATSRTDWAHFDAVVGPIAAVRPVLPAIGNHDYRCILVRVCSQRVIPVRFKQRFSWFSPGQAYTVPFGDVLLVFLDSETGIQAQGSWLRQQLRDFELSYRALLVFSHRPPYTNSIVADVGPDQQLLEHIVPVLNRLSVVSVYFSGHAHGYEHLLVGDRHYFVSAGGGGPRGWLSAARPNDMYRGRECRRDDADQVLRPYNYLVLQIAASDLHVSVRGFCRGDAEVTELESLRIALENR